MGYREYLKSLPPKPKMEFSKKILIAVFVATLIIVVCAMGMSYMTQTTDVYAYLIPAIFAELGIGTGFYYWKSKKENEIKLRSAFGNEREMELVEDEYID